MAEVKTPVRRLVDLHPKWTGIYGTERKGTGLQFTCPCLDARCPWGGEIYVTIENPLDGGPAAREAPPRWKRTGNTFDILTLSPSIHAEGHWHGWVRDGCVVSV